ncbi:MAG: hypothetical protein ACTSUE_02285 [Promethearchaeota archaeon]
MMKEIDWTMVDREATYLVIAEDGKYYRQTIEPWDTYSPCINAAHGRCMPINKEERSEKKCYLPTVFVSKYQKKKYTFMFCPKLKKECMFCGKSLLD